MKTINIFIISSILLITSLVSANAESTLDKIMQTGVLKVGTTGDFPGWSFKNPATNAYEGFDIEVAKQFAADMDVELEFVPTDWKNLVSGVIASKYYMTASASITTKRAIQAGYSDSYYGTGTVAMTLKKNIDKFSGWESVDGTTVAVTLGTVFENEAKKSFPNSKVIAVESPARDFQEVLSGRSLVSLTSKVEAIKLMQTYPQLQAINFDEPKNAKLFAILLPRADQEWINFVNHWIKDKKNQGFFISTANKFGL
jgi:cyclohexadienyl dehydratase